MSSEKERFFISHREGSAFGLQRQVLVDRQTGVNYLVVQSGYSGGITPLLDREGRPVVTRLGTDFEEYR